jgi:hypothetical protein
MPRQKIRNKKRIDVDITLCIRLDQFRKQWEAMFEEPISEIEMTKIFGEFAKIDFKKIRKYKGDGNNV